MSRIVRGTVPHPTKEPEFRLGDELPVDYEPPTPRAVPRQDPLPAEARAKLVALQGQATDARDAAASASRRLNELRQKLGYGDRPPPDAPGIEVEMSRLSALRAAQD